MPPASLAIMGAHLRDLALLTFLIGCPCAVPGQAASSPPQWLRLLSTLGSVLASAASLGCRVTPGSPRRALLRPARVAKPAAIDPLTLRCFSASSCQLWQQSCTLLNCEDLLQTSQLCIK